MLKNFEPRLYQQTILGTAVKHNTLVVLPTGLGKTALAFLLAIQRLHKFPDSKILMLAPTKPLCEQHVDTFRKHLEIEESQVVLFTGSVTPTKRQELWKTAKIIISTPQGLENDLINRRISFEEVSALVFDECHHATKDYSYVWLAEQYQQRSLHPKILALTASPGATLDKIQEICKNLFIKKVEVRTNADYDVKPYVKKTEVDWIGLEFPEDFKRTHKELKSCAERKLNLIKSFGYITTININKTQVLKLQRFLQSKLSQEGQNFEVLKSLSLVAEVLKVEHALELLECQGIKPLHTYLQKLWEESKTTKTKAVKNLAIDHNFRTAMILTESLNNRNIGYPKLTKLTELINEELNKDQKSKIIVFTNYRDSAQEISRHLGELAIKHEIFVGQAKKNGLGLTQKKQKEMLDQFRNEEFNVLVSTSVAEEGLDIPKVHKVIFYEATASAIRNIQRRGRTGRLEKGQVSVMFMKNTRDEAYRWASHHKEKGMYKVLNSLKVGAKNINKNLDEQFQTINELNGKINPFVDKKNNVKVDPNNKTLSEFENKQTNDKNNILILADHREKDNKIVKGFISEGVNVKLEQLQIADYLISGKVAVELKKVPDFVNSLIDGRLLEQVKKLKENFEKSIVIVEGEEDIYAVRNIHANAIRGAIASIVLGYNIPIIYTRDPEDTIAMLIIMAKREQQPDSKEFSMHTSKPLSMKEQQEYLISALPGVGLGMARLLLKELGSVKKLVNCNEENLVKIKGVGKKTSERIVNLFDKEYVECDKKR
ncbi:DEAD/DEAH box helicase [archaeon]|jgi:ERCC4-related helicase/ERCC4-type nuclease|nr:DEAD/DEAH box helicase [archaeon]MBT3451673.1 DEAD/DEAH box helicase [archaeon]MBT6869117.1 DEAD/DEAH box helicase [archaeon]MBT7193360.1 DEAD/DEAH box helicase [archaeon]MBT7380368.1 DEAD/DEAH box helicase [archaeon]